MPSSIYVILNARVRVRASVSSFDLLSAAINCFTFFYFTVHNSVLKSFRNDDTQRLNVIVVLKDRR